MDSIPKVILSSQPIISVITVTYNAERFIERTLRSIASQTYPYVESILIDGQSTDNTIELINQYKIHNSKLTSERDKGLYDAMNKGIDLSSGDYIIFMNAGDVFYDSNTISKAFLMNDSADFVYGDTIFINEQGVTSPPFKNKPSQDQISFKSFINGMVVCHQSMFIKRSKAEKFDISEYRLACDIDWVIRSLKNCTTHRDTGLIISKFLIGGVSQSHKWKAVKERFWISVKHFGWFATFYQNIKMVIFFLIKKLFKYQYNRN